MTLYKWSQTASADATADGTINWAEGQSPSSVNDSARAMMAATAKYRDDIAGAIVTAGISTAYTVSSYEVFETLVHLNGQMIAFTPHVTNGATVTLNVDSLGARPLRSAPGVELPAGTLIQGTPYVVVYNHASAAFYLHGFFGNPYNIPLGGALPFFGTTAPNSSFVLPYGQAVSRSTYSALFTLFSTTYGVGDGSTTFNIPDLRGRAIIGKDDMGGSAASRVTTAGGGIDGATLGAVGGGQISTLATANLPAQTPSGTVAVTGTGSPVLRSGGSIITAGGGAGGTLDGVQPGTGTLSAITATAVFTGTAFAGQTATSFTNLPPSIVCNYILRVI